MVEVKMWEDSRLPLVGVCVREKVVATVQRGRVQGDEKTGDKLCQRRDKVNKFIG
jgi:hypothetical protein